MDCRFDDSQCSFCSARSEKTENYSAARPPQRNESNVSSNQVASTTAALLDLKLAAAKHSHPHLGADKDDRDPNYPLDHRPPSDMSNVTASTDATAAANVAHSNVTFTTPTYTFASRGLTESALAQHQHELQLVKPGDMAAWLEGAAPGYTQIAVAPPTNNRRRRPPRSHPSQASDASYDFVAAPTTVAGQNQDVRATGALFDEQALDPYTYTHLDV
jgi:hypothetical protein